MSANDAFLLGFGENVHDAFVALGPVALGKAVHEANVNVIGAELATEAVEIGAGGGGVAGPSFGENGDTVARNVLKRFGNVRVAAVGIGRVEETKAVIVTVEEQVGEAFDAERGLVRMVADADGSSAHGEAAGLDPSLAERNGVGGIELSRKAGKSESAPREYRRMEPRRTCGVNGAMDEFAAIHGTSSRGMIADACLLYRRTEKVFGYWPHQEIVTLNSRTNRWPEELRNKGTARQYLISRW